MPILFDQWLFDFFPKKHIYPKPLHYKHATWGRLPRHWSEGSLNNSTCTSAASSAVAAKALPLVTVTYLLCEVELNSAPTKKWPIEPWWRLSHCNKEKTRTKKSHFFFNRWDDSNALERRIAILDRWSLPSWLEISLAWDISRLLGWTNISHHPILRVFPHLPTATFQGRICNRISGG